MFDNVISQPIDPASLVVDYVPKPFILCLYKSLSDSDIDVLRQHGRVILFGPAYINRPVHTFQFDYLIIDFREEDHRFYYQRYIKRHFDRYHIILFRYSFETNNGITFHNELVDFPPSQISKDEFDAGLLEPPLPAPHCFLSLCHFCCKK